MPAVSAEQTRCAKFETLMSQATRLQGYASVVQTAGEEGSAAEAASYRARAKLLVSAAMALTAVSEGLGAGET